MTATAAAAAATLAGTLTRPRRLLTVATLTAVWCALWGEVSVANVAAGLVVAAAVVASGIGTAGEGRVRLVPLLRLLWLVAVDLVRSTVDVAAEILTITDHTDESIVAVEIPPAGRDHLLLLVVAITLTPGTAVVDADPDAGIVYLHLLHDRRRAETVAHVQRLTEAACRALPMGRGPVATAAGPPGGRP